MAEPKTRKTGASVEQFLRSIEDEKRRRDARRLRALMREITGEKAVMWGPSIVGFGSYHYRYASGREGDWMLTGFSPRKQALTIYIMDGFGDHGTLMEKLGKYRTGKSCLYIRRLEDVDLDVLRRLVGESVDRLRAKYA